LMRNVRFTRTDNGVVISGELAPRPAWGHAEYAVLPCAYESARFNAETGMWHLNRSGQAVTQARAVVLMNEDVWVWI
jgi:hypothetical protein